MPYLIAEELLDLNENKYTHNGIVRANKKII